MNRFRAKWELYATIRESLVSQLGLAVFAFEVVQKGDGAKNQRDAGMLSFRRFTGTDQRQFLIGFENHQMPNRFRVIVNFASSAEFFDQRRTTLFVGFCQVQAKTLVAGTRFPEEK